MLVAGMYAISKNPSVFIAGGLYAVSKNLFVFSLMKPSAFRIGCAFFNLFGASGRTAFGIIVFFF